MTKEYNYHVDENSLTQGWLIRFVWTPLGKFIPDSITPNTITVCGAFFLQLSAVFVWWAYQGHSWAFVPAAMCVFLYMAGDNLDGAHARRTGQSSKLGEFLDHWLDSINAVVLNLCVLSVLFLHGWLLIFCLIGVAVAFFATIWEHHHTGIFHSDKMGTNEGLILIIGLYLVLSYFFKHSFFIFHGPEKINVPTIIGYMTMASCLFTIGGILLRVKKHLTDFIPLLLAMAAVALWALAGNLNQLVAGALILAINIPFCSRFILERLAGLEHLNYRGWGIAFTAILALAFFPFRAYCHYPIEYFAYAALSLLFLISIYDLTIAVKSLKAA